MTGLPWVPDKCFILNQHVARRNAVEISGLKVLDHWAILEINGTSSKNTLPQFPKFHIYLQSLKT